MKELLNAATAWGKSESAVRGLLLVGSHARGTANSDSDIDLLFLCSNPASFRSTQWLGEINWPRELRISRWDDEEYGSVWSRRLWLYPKGEVEFGFAALSWAETSPVDKGTAEVLRGGFQILYDPDTYLSLLAVAYEKSPMESPDLPRSARRSGRA